MDKNERERKQLNKKLIWRTFISELKNRKRRELVPEFLFEFFSFLAAILLSEFIVKKIHHEFWLIELVIFLLFISAFHIVKDAFLKTRRNADK